MSARDEVLLLDPQDIGARLKRWRLRIAVLAVVVAVGAYFAARYAGVPSATYTSSAEIKIIPTGAELSYARSALGGSRDSQSIALVRTFIETMKSDAVVNRAISQLPVGEGNEVLAEDANPFVEQLKSLIQSARDTIEYLNYGDVIDGEADPTLAYRDAITIQSITGSFVIRLNVSLKDPDTSVALATALVDALQSVLIEQNAAAKDQIRDQYSQRIQTLERDLVGLIDEELRIREEIGALDLEAQLELLTETLTEQTSMLMTLRFQFDQFPERSDSQHSQPLIRKIDALKTQIREVTQLRSDLVKKDFQLRSNRFQQDSLAEAIALGRQVFSSPELGDETGVVEIDIVRAPKKAVRPDPPTPLLLAVIAGLGVIVCGYVLLILLSAGGSLVKVRDSR